MLMTTGKYVNRLVMALNAPYIGYVATESDDRLVVFGERNARYDIPKTEIKTVSKNVLIDMNFEDIVYHYQVERNVALPERKNQPEPWIGAGNIDLAAYEKKFNRTLFNLGVRAKNEDHVGHVMKETDDKIVVFGHYDYRYDIPKSRIIAVGRNVIVDMDFPQLFVYLVDKNKPLPA